MTRSFLLLPVLVLSAFPLVPAPAAADSMNSTRPIVEAIDMQTEASILGSQQNIEAIKEFSAQLGDQMKKNALASITPDITVGSGADEATLLSERQGALAAHNALVNDIMITRTNQLNGIPLGGTDLNTSPLVDPALAYQSEQKTSKKVSINEQLFRNYMRYFCDPLANNGALNGDTWFGTETNKRISCGDSEFSDAKSSRKKFNVADTPENKIAEREIVQLPINPARLFFEARTFPVAKATPSTDNPTGRASNVNPYAELYYNAINMSMNLLLPPPSDVFPKESLNTSGGRAEYLELQAKNTRNAVASYPFALLAADRFQIMNHKVSQRLADLLEQNMDNADLNPAVGNAIARLRSQDGVSMAEYMDIMMYQIPLSPGYVASINKKTPEELAREKIKLTAMQLAVGYQRNHWIEILTALEAMRPSTSGAALTQ